MSGTKAGAKKIAFYTDSSDERTFMRESIESGGNSLRTSYQPETQTGIEAIREETNESSVDLQSDNIP